MPVKGDHSDREILRYRRIRVERQEVLPGDTAPMLCGRGPILLLSGRAGALARSVNGGVTWERLGSLREHAGPNGHVLTLAELAPDCVLAALYHQGAITVLLSGDFGETWQAGGRIAYGAEAAAGPARFEATPGGPLSLWIGATAFRSSDGGNTWAATDEIPVGAGPDHPGSVREQGGRVSLPDGRLLLTYAEPCYPYGARAVISADGGDTWGDEVYVLGHARAATNTLQPRPLRCDPGAGAVSVALDDGAIVSAYDRGAAIPPAMAPMDGRRMDESSHGPAIVAVRWTPEGLRRPPLVYPNLSSHRVDSRGYLDNGLIRMRPDDRFEGGDFIEDYEMIVFRRRPAEQRFFAGAGTKGLVVCRHPDGSLVFASRTSAIHRSTDEGRTWTRVAEVRRPGNQATTFAFGVTARGTLLMGYSTLLRPADPAERRAQCPADQHRAQRRPGTDVDRRAAPAGADALRRRGRRQPHHRAVRRYGRDGLRHRVDGRDGLRSVAAGRLPRRRDAALARRRQDLGRLDGVASRQHRIELPGASVRRAALRHPLSAPRGERRLLRRAVRRRYRGRLAVPLTQSVR